MQRTRLISIGTPLVVLWAALDPLPASAAVLRVDVDAMPGGNGASWPTAFNDLQSALDMSLPFDQIWVADGTYKPTLASVPGDPRSVTFNLPDNTFLFGGFQGLSHPEGGETMRSQRDPELYPTILSGNVGIVGDATDNAYHVVTADGVSDGARLDGFVVRDGYAVGISNQGAGMLITGITQATPGPLVVRCTFTLNFANTSGGAVQITSPTGPGPFDNRPQFLACTFDNNSSAYRGGAIYADPGAIARFVNCLAFRNATANNGAFLYSAYADVEIVNCTVSQNVSEGSVAGAIELQGGVAEIVNTIIWGNINPDGSPEAAQIHIFEPGLHTISYCDIQNLSLLAGNSNIGSDPQFLDPQGGNFRLAYLSHALNNANASDTPADTYDIDDDGDTSEKIPDRDMNPRQVNPTVCVDIGSHEHQTTGTCPGDITDPAGGGPDGVVGNDDLRLVLETWGSPGGVADLAPEPCGNSVVNVSDHVFIFLHWGPCPGAGAGAGAGTGTSQPSGPLTAEQAIAILLGILEEHPELEEPIQAMIDYLTTNGLSTAGDQ